VGEAVFESSMMQEEEKSNLQMNKSELEEKKSKDSY